MIYQTIHPENDAKSRSPVIIQEYIAQYEELERTAEFHFTVLRPMLLGTLYCPPRHNKKSKDYVTVSVHFDEIFIFGGDYIVKVEIQIDNVQGTRIDTFTQQVYSICKLT